MNTVKDYKDAGLVFVGDDTYVEKYAASNDLPIAIEESFARMLNENYEKHTHWNDNLISQFAWRTNTGVKPSYRGEIEVTVGSGGTNTCLFDDFLWSIGSIIKWRPLIKKEQPPESECALSPNFELAPQSLGDEEEVEKCLSDIANLFGLKYGTNCGWGNLADKVEAKLKSTTREAAKPIYTQAMWDAGELPSVGMELLFFKDSKLTKKKWTMGTFAGKAYSAGGCAVFLFVDHETKSTHVVELDIQFKPLTPPVTLIDGKAYQFDYDGANFDGIYRSFDNSFYGYDGDTVAEDCTNIKPLTVEGE